MGKEPDPHACRPNSMDLNDAAYMRDEAERAFNDARKTRGKRDLLYVAVMACVIVMLTAPYAEERTSSSLPPSSPSRSHAPEAWHATA